MDDSEKQKPQLVPLQAVNNEVGNRDRCMRNCSLRK